MHEAARKGAVFTSRNARKCESHSPRTGGFPFFRTIHEDRRLIIDVARSLPQDRGAQVARGPFPARRACTQAEALI